jgi:Zn-dependent protease
MFYRVNSTKVTVREYLFESGVLLRPISWLVAVITKSLRLRLPGSVDFPPVERLSPFLVASDSVDSDLLHLLAPEREWLASQQFTYCGDVYLNDVTSNTRYASCIFLSPNRKSIAWVRVRRWPHLPAKAKTTRVQFVSCLEDGTVAVTTSANRDLQEPLNWNVQFHTGTPVQDLYRSHEEHCERAFGSHRQRQFASTTDAITFLDELQGQFALFQASRGVFEPIEIQVRPAVSQTSSSLNAERPIAGSEPNTEPTYTEPTYTEPPVLLNTSASPTQISGEDLVVAAVRKLEMKQTQLLSKLLLLGVSVVAFLAVGGALWDWSFVLMIIPILLIHELGHLLAMKIFGYKNVNMFFIPFFGAAVTGRHYNVAGWKKALVSLAGPVPSIALAIVLEIIGFVTEIEWMSQAALLMLILNLFNLLPFLPLDGGWVAHITLFSRSKYMDIGFRIVAVLAMFLVTIVAGDKIMMYLGIVMLISLPTVWRTLKIQEKLTNEPLPLPADDLIPEAAIRKISKACQSANLPAANTSQLAATTIRVYEAINTRPTSWPATIGLWALHGGAVVVGIIGLIGYLAGTMVKRMSDIADTQYETISYEIPKNSLEFQVGQGALPEAAMLAWQFADENQAAQAMASFKDNPQHSVCRFGNLVLMSAFEVEQSSAPREQSEVLAEMMKLPSDKELAIRNDPQLQSFRQQFAAIDARIFNSKQESLPYLKVTFGDANSCKRVMSEFEIMPSLEMNGQLLAPWTIGRKPTADQLRMRRLLHVILERTEKLPWVVDEKDNSEIGRNELDKMSKEEVDAYWAKLEEEGKRRAAENAKLKKKWISDGLKRSTGETKKMIEAVLRFDEDQETARQAYAKSPERSGLESSAQAIKYPKLSDYLAESAEALGYVDSSAPEYRYGVNAVAYVDSSGEEGVSPDAQGDDAASMDTELLINLDEPIDSVAAYSAIIAWLYSQGAQSISMNYDRVVLSDEMTVTN